MPRSKHHWLFPAATVALLMFSGAVAGHGYKKKNLEIVHPWTAETAGTATAVYMTIRNSASEPDRLLRASTAIAAKSQLRASPSGEQAGAMDTQSVLVPAHGEAALSRDGVHLQLEGLTQKLGAYDRFNLELVFERAGSMAIEVMVEETTAP